MQAYGIASSINEPLTIITMPHYKDSLGTFTVPEAIDAKVRAYVPPIVEYVEPISTREDDAYKYPNWTGLETFQYEKDQTQIHRVERKDNDFRCTCPEAQETATLDNCDHIIKQKKLAGFDV